MIKPLKIEFDLFDVGGPTFDPDTWVLYENHPKAKLDAAECVVYLMNAALEIDSDPIHPVALRELQIVGHRLWMLLNHPTR